MKIIPYGKQSIDKSDINAVIETLKSDFLTQGPKILEFEKNFANYVGAKYAVAVSNGTTALHLAVRVLGIKENEYALTTPITFSASANCVLYCGGKVDFVDIDPKTYCMDINLLEDELKKNPNKIKGIVPVSFAGYPLELSAFRKLADKYNFWIIEDACHAFGAEYIDGNNQWQKTGNSKYADISVFSFHPVKHVTTGEGGMLTTNSQEIYEKLLLLRSHGIRKTKSTNPKDGEWFQEMIDLGFNYRITDIQCSLGNSQLKRADANLSSRRKIAAKYDEAFKNIGEVVTPYVDKTKAKHGYHLYVVQVNNRLEVYNYLREKGIYTQVHYVPIHMMDYYKKNHPTKNSLKRAEEYYQHCLSIPMYHSLTEADQATVIEEIKKAVKIYG
ncbi:MAG: UDP-4-amino-4,6-dideoxy-N-acetyl-beta-L-altrosamine transaminase [Bacteriovoracaceae bacterium]